jgi:cation diffusion facilitator CzcD-associated flavoprotein CzcO
VHYDGEDGFGGAVVEGNGGGPDGVDFTGKRVLILGMGAFAVENVRTCLLGGATQVTVLTRRLNLVVSRFGIFLGFQLDSKLKRGFDTATEQKQRAAAMAARAKAKAAAEAAAASGESTLGSVDRRAADAVRARPGRLSALSVP